MDTPTTRPFVGPLSALEYPETMAAGVYVLTTTEGAILHVDDTTHSCWIKAAQYCVWLHDEPDDDKRAMVMEQFRNRTHLT